MEMKSTLLNSSKSDRAIHASHALLGSQVSVFSSPSFLGPLGYERSKEREGEILDQGDSSRRNAGQDVAAVDSKGQGNQLIGKR